MSKAVLVIEMPENCEGCVLEVTANKSMHCLVSDRYLMTRLIGQSADKPDWCPLKPLPERDDNEYISEYARGCKRGWNDAIKAIDE